MPLVIHNTLSRQREEFRPAHPPQVKMYACGPTVYDYAHVGNFRYFVFVDLLRRFLEYKGYQVNHVMNVTDVEDKIIRKIRETKKTLPELTGFYTQEFFNDLKTLNVKSPTTVPLATEHIREIIAIIEKLIANGVAYQAADKSVYFSIAKFSRYGQLKRIDFSEMRQGERVKSDEYEKEAIADFALWKAWQPDDGDVAWDSPWGRGRPGWHIECSAMSMKYLGESFDIHCGGEDLVFPHHEDEIAQSEAATGKHPFVRYWVHCAFLLVEGQKMSKKLGNFYTLRDLLQRGCNPRAIRYALLSANYRDPLNFTIQGVAAAEKSLERMDEFLLKLREISAAAQPGSTGCAEIETLKQQFEIALDDDLNISAALAALFEFIRVTNRRIAQNQLSPPEAALMLQAWEQFDSVLGLGMPKTSEVPSEIQALLDQRNAARREKDFKRSDAIRDELKAKGWIIEDTPQGARLKKF